MQAANLCGLCLWIRRRKFKRLSFIDYKRVITYESVLKTKISFNSHTNEVIKNSRACLLCIGTITYVPTIYYIYSFFPIMNNYYNVHSIIFYMYR